MATIDQQFVEFVVKALVSDPDSVTITRTIDEKGVLLELNVAQEDLGRVIGKRGNTAQSIRTLLRALGTKNDARYNLKIVDPEGDKKRAERQEEKANNDNSGSEDDASVAPAPAPEPSESSNQWSHLSSSQDDSDEEDVDNTTDEEEDSSTEAENDTVEKHKKDLADLDDLGL